MTKEEKRISDMEAILDRATELMDRVVVVTHDANVAKRAEVIVHLEDGTVRP